MACRYQKYREEEAKRLEEKVERKRVRAEKLARGEEVGPEDRDEDAWSLWDVIKTLIVIIGGIALTGQLVTGSLVWGNKSRLTNVQSWWPVSGLVSRGSSYYLLICKPVPENDVQRESIGQVRRY